MGEINSGDNVKASASIPLEYFCSGNDAQQSSASTARGRHTEAPVGTPEPDTVTLFCGAGFYPLFWQWL